MTDSSNIRVGGRGHPRSHGLLNNRHAAVVGTVYMLFLATGISGLVCQVAWQRYLLNIFGATLYSVSTVVAAFMGGLALGSWLFGGIAERARARLALYGVLEILVAATALAVPQMLRVLDPLFIAIYRMADINFFFFSLVRLIVVFTVLLIPTTMMGGTLPLLAKFVTDHPSGAGTRVGLLYALNTAGAVAGTFLGGFYFIRWWGISGTVAFAAVINAAAGATALVLWFFAGRPSKMAPAIDDSALSGMPAEPADLRQTSAPATVRKRIWLVMTAYTVSGFIALGLEITWTRALVFTFDVLKNTTYSFSAMLATFLAGIALGSAVMTPILRRRDDAPPPGGAGAFRLFAALQALIGLSSIFSFFMIYYVCYDLGNNWLKDIDPISGQIHWGAAVTLVFLRAAAAIFLPTFCMGLAFPAAVQAVAGSSGAVGRDVGRLYALNTIGAIFGATLTGFFLLPGLGIANTIFLFGAIQLIMGLVLICRDNTSSQNQRIVWLAAGSAALIVAFVRLPRPAFFQPATIHEPVTAFYKEGPLATVAVMQNTLGYRTIYVDNVGVAGTDPMLMTDQKSLAHMPMLLLPRARSALTVGFGSGGASYSYTLYPELERIDCAEIAKTVIEAAPALTASNHDIVMNRGEYIRRTGREPEGKPLWNDGGDSGWFKADKRYRIILDDVRSYLRFTGATYDIIATDCTDLRYKSNANLYDVEYFTLCRDHITSQGMVVVWMPLAGLSNEAMRVALRSFYTVFPNMDIFYMNNQPTHYILLTGTARPLKVDLKMMTEKMALPAVARDLAEVNLDQPEKLLSCFVTGRATLGEYLKGRTLNTENFPYLEFESPRCGYNDAALLDNLDALMAIREDPARLIDESAGVPARFLQSLRRYSNAVTAIIKGHRLYREMKIGGAAKAYMNAQEIAPDDSAIRNLLEFRELRRKVLGQPGNIWARWQLAQIHALLRRDGDAVTEINELLRLISSNGNAAGGAREIQKAAWPLLADIYERNSKPDKAAQYRKLTESGAGSAGDLPGQPK
ncbi:MAG: fused MFS/spermidine synthase [bacterium]